MSMSPFALPRELSHTTNFPHWPNPCGVLMSNIQQIEVSFRIYKCCSQHAGTDRHILVQVTRDQWVPVNFTDLQPPFRVYGV